MSMYVESKVRTKKLWCSDCGEKIRIGEEVIFELDNMGRMISVYCNMCKGYYEDEVEFSGYPFMED